jgi:hypothetical protein
MGSCVEKAVIWHAPDKRGSEFEAISGRIPKVNGTSPAWPGHVLLDFDSVLVQVGDPQIEFAERDREGDMSGSTRSVRNLGLQESSSRIENQQHLVSAFEEDVAAFLLCEKFQAENLFIKEFSACQVVGVE